MLPLQLGETRKGRPPQLGGGGEGSKKGRTLLLDYSATATEGEDEWLLKPSPWRSRKYPDARLVHSIPLSHCFS